MDTEKCRALLAVLEAGSLSAAAEKLDYTPSGLSRMMAALEQELGFPLLSRSHNGVQPTRACRTLLPTLRELTHWSALLEAQAADIRGIETGTIAVGCVYGAYYGWLSRCIARFCEVYPGIEVQVLQGNSSQLTRAVSEHTADFCITSFREGDFDWIPLYADPMVAWLPPEHPLAGGRTFPLAAFATGHHAECPLHVRGQPRHLCHGAGRSRRESEQSTHHPRLGHDRHRDPPGRSAAICRDRHRRARAGGAVPGGEAVSCLRPADTAHGSRGRGTWKGASMKVSELPYRRVTREEMTEGLQRVIERVRAAQSVEEILAARAEYLSLTTEYATAQSLSYMRYTINTVDPFYLAEKDYYDEIGPEVENLALQYTSAVLDSPFREELETVLSPILLRSMELQRRSMSPEIIDDMVEENKLVSEYAQLMAGMLFPFRGEQLPRPMLMKYARSADRATRRECYEALGTTLEAHSAQLDDLFDRLVHVRDRMAKKMGYQNFIELGYCRMERMCYDVQAVQTFRENIVRDIVPGVSRLRLGIDTFRLYDNEFFTPGGDPTPCGKDDLFAAAQKMYDAMGDVPGAFFRMMCENEAFDVESRPNKWGGGYCTEFPKFRQPFILANFNGTSGDVDVVTHEAGHALNAYLIADNRFALELGCGGMETAETHSMSMEFFAWPYLDAFFPKAGDAERYRFQHALDALSFLPYGTMVDEFQHRVYAEPDLTSAGRNAVWLELEAKYRPYIDQSGIPYLERGTRWQYQMHIYETPFYYIDYCLAQTAAFQFLLASQDDYDGAFARYLHLSQQGGEKLWTDLLAEAGFRSPFEPGALAQLEPLIRKHTV